MILGSKYPPPKRGEKYPEQIVKLGFVVDDLKRTLEAGGRPSKATTGFIEDMPADLKEKFVRCGLLEKSESVSLKGLFKRFYDSTSERKDSTERTYITVEKRFFRFFDPAGDPADLTKKDGENWKQFLKDEGYSEATICGCFQRMSTVLNFGVEQEYLDKNPFKGIKRGSFVNPNRRVYVPMEWYWKLLDACRDDQTWRTIIALCRIGGLRNPSETLHLKWEDVDWSTGWINVFAPKTGRTRSLPIFDDLKVELERQRKLTEGNDCPYVIDKWRTTSANLRTFFNETIIFRAGLSKWDSPFNNLRASASTDVEAEFGVRCESIWIGHSTKIAQRHYFQITDEEHLKALSWSRKTAGETVKPVDPLLSGTC